VIRPEVKRNIQCEFPNDLRAQDLRIKEISQGTLSVAESAELRARKLLPGNNERLIELLVGHALNIITDAERKELFSVVAELARMICPVSAQAQAIKCKQILGETITEEESAIVESTHLYPTSVIARELYILRRMGRATKEQVKQLAEYPDSTSEE
jgi:regulator of replication initiation timing